jgi:hypothetical protein
MGIEDGLPPSSPPPPIDSPLLTPALDRFPAFDFTSPADSSLFAIGLDFESPNSLDFTSATRLPELFTNSFNLDAFGLGWTHPLSEAAQQILTSSQLRLQRQL